MNQNINNESNQLHVPKKIDDDTTGIKATTSTYQQENDISTVLQNKCSAEVNVKTVNQTSLDILQEKYPGYFYYEPSAENKHLFEIKEYLKNVKGTRFEDGTTKEEKQKTQLEIDTQFFKDVPRTEFQINSTNMLELYKGYSQENITPDLQEKIEGVKNKDEYFELLKPSLPKIVSLSEEEKTAVFALRTKHGSLLNLDCFLPWFDNYILQKIDKPTFNPRIKPNLNDIKILSQQGVNSNIFELLSCYYTKKLHDVVCLDLTKQSQIPPVFLKKLEINLENDNKLLCNIKISDDNIQWFWQKQFVLICPTNNLFTLAKIIGSTYIDWNSNVYILWKITWLNSSIEKFVTFVQNMNNQDNQDNPENQIHNNYTGGATKQETEDALINLVVEMEKYIFDEEFNEKFPKNLEALVQYFTDTIKDTSNIETINNYMAKVQNINNAIKDKLNDPESNDSSIINFEKVSNESTLSVNTNPQQQSSFQKIRNIGANLGTSISNSASNLTKTVKDGAINLSTDIQNRASQVGNAVNEGISTLTSTTNASGKMVIANEAVTLGSAIAGIALMTPLLVLGGSKKRKNIKKKKYTKKRKNTKRNHKKSIKNTKNKKNKKIKN